MMRVLLVTDLSEAGLLSVEGVLGCGSDAFRAITLLHVIDLDLYTAGGSVPQIRDWAQEELRKAAEELRAAGFNAAARVEIGPVLDTVKAVADDEDTDLIVATNLGKGAMAGRLLGSTAERLPVATGLPVLIERVKREGERWCRQASGSPFERILLGVDLEGDVAASIAAVRGLPGLKALRVVHVAAEEGRRADAQRKLEAASGAVAAGAAVEAVSVVGRAAEGLLDQAREFEAGSVAVTACRHGMLHRGVLGSVAHSVASEADRAVLLLPPA